MAKGKYEKWLSPEGLLQLEAWARDGLTDEQIANNMNINVASLYRYKSKHCEICEALKRGKVVTDIQVENALLKRALGYSYKETKREVSEEGIKVTETTKEVVPDTTAQIFWLKNRKALEWKNNPSPPNDNLANGIHISNAKDVFEVIYKVIELTASGKLDKDTASIILSSCKTILDCIRTEEQEKKIEELAQLLKQLG